LAAARAAAQVVGAAPFIKPPSGAIGGELGVLPLEPQVRRRADRKLVPRAPAPARIVMRLFSRSPFRAPVRAAVAGRR
jgi:hypothetical protein